MMEWAMPEAERSISYLVRVLEMAVAVIVATAISIIVLLVLFDVVSP